jgi:glycosyltransferase involved in cell wall biosynthesis
MAPAHWPSGLMEIEPRVHVLHREKKEGLGRAYLAGFRWALERDYEVIFEMDADFSHDPERIPDFSGPWRPPISSSVPGMPAA